MSSGGIAAGEKEGLGWTATIIRGSVALPCSCDPLKGEKQTCVGLRPGLKTAEEGTWVGL